MADPLYRRVLIKLSGEALMGDQPFGIAPDIANRICTEIASVARMGVGVGVVVGGGNYIRGAQLAETGLDRVTADHMGMMGTVMNAIALKACFRSLDVSAEAFSALAIPEVCESFTQRAALESMSENAVTLFGGGVGAPFFSTDTASALRAWEMGCDAILKATQVDGIYSADPKKDPTAERFDTLTHDEVLRRGLSVMDTAAVSLARDRQIPIVVFSIHEPGELIAVVAGNGRATTVSG
ncbi:MAG: UMP kinase [Pseudomonadota bacterium]